MYHPLMRLTSLLVLSLVALGCGGQTNSNLDASHNGGASGSSGQSGAGGSAQAGDGGSSGSGGSSSGGSTTGGSAGNGGNAGNAGNAGAAAVAGSGGVGGSNVFSCQYLVPLGEPTLAVGGTEESRSEAFPHLITNEGDGPSVILEFLATPDNLAGGISEMRHIGFDPWTWIQEPSSALDLYQGSTSVGMRGFAAGYSAIGGVALFYAGDDFDPSLPVTYLAPSVPYQSTPNGFPLDSEYGSPVTVHTTDTTSVAVSQVYSDIPEGSTFLRVSNRENATGLTGVWDNFACATMPMSAKSLPGSASGESLLAFTTSRLCCQCDDGIDGPPNMGVVAQILQSNSNENMSVVTLEGDAFAWVDLVRTPQGYWLFSRGYGLNAEAQPDIEARPLDAAGQMLEELPVHTLPNIGVSDSTRPAFTSLGNGFAVAWVDNNTNEVWVRAYSATGEEGQSVSVGVASNPRISLLNSPDNQHLLVTWSEAQSSVIDRLRVVRVDCVIPLLHSCREPSA